MKTSASFAVALAAAMSTVALNSPAQPGSLDTTFDVGAGAISVIRHVAVQSDGKLLIAGEFSSISGFLHDGIARLNVDGTLDNTFAKPLPPSPAEQSDIYWVHVQLDGKILIAGRLTSGAPNESIVRLNSDGSFDSNFNPLGWQHAWSLHSWVMQPDGKILCSGWDKGIIRLNPDGSRDSGFDPGAGAGNGNVFELALQSDGKVLVGGTFLTFGGMPRIRIARLNSNGSLDTSFDPGSGPNESVNFIWVQPDGKVVIWGNFTVVRDVPQNGVARLNIDGTLDTSFNPGHKGTVNDLATQPDGKLVLAAGNKIVRLNSDWNLDTNFDSGSGADNSIYSVCLEPDGQILVGGTFAQVNGVYRNHIARLNGDD